MLLSLHKLSLISQTYCFSLILTHQLLEFFSFMAVAHSRELTTVVKLISNAKYAIISWQRSFPTKNKDTGDHSEYQESIYFNMENGDQHM
ncbi:unnamed protein product [Amaranthus hypochondriacus]